MGKYKYYYGNYPFENSLTAAREKIKQIRKSGLESDRRLGVFKTSDGQLFVTRVAEGTREKMDIYLDKYLRTVKTEKYIDICF